MAYFVPKENDEGLYSTAILVKDVNFSVSDISKYYSDPLVRLGVAEDSMVFHSLNYFGAKKVKVSLIAEFLEELLPALKSFGVTKLLVADLAYFKVLTGVSMYGEKFPSVFIEGFECVLVPSYARVFYDPSLQEEITLALNTLAVEGVRLGKDIIKDAYYPKGDVAIAEALEGLHKYPELTVDIETFSLDFHKAGIGTIAFAWDKHSGIAFTVDTVFSMENKEVRRLLRRFFNNYKGKCIYHKAMFDVKILCYSLYMSKLLDYEGLLVGLNILTKNIDCTALISYLALNTCGHISLSLKALAHEFAGNYAVSNINDITKIPEGELLEYNLIDCLSTHYVHEKYYPRLCADEQEDIYRTIFLPSVRLLLQVELSGIPIDMDIVYSVEETLQRVYDEGIEAIEECSLVQSVSKELSEVKTTKDFLSRKEKAKNPDKTKVIPREVVFNPHSGNHVAFLLHNHIGLEVLETTATGLPSTGVSTLELYLKRVEDALETLTITDKETL